MRIFGPRAETEGLLSFAYNYSAAEFEFEDFM